MAGELIWNGDQFEKELRRLVAEHLEAAAAILQAEIVRSLRVSARIGKNLWQASRPGEPPRARTGLLMKSIFYSVDQGSMTAIVGTSLKYGLYLELGTSRMAARPFIRPAIDRVRQKLDALGIHSAEFGIEREVAA